MKKIIITTAILFFAIIEMNAQIFIDKATIQYEVKSNLKKTMGSSTWAEAMAEKMPTFKVGYYNLTFADNKSIYKFDSWFEKEKLPEFWRTDDKSTYYTDFNIGRIYTEKDMIGSVVNVEDSLRKLEWRLTNENRIIAGFNCKKAVAKIFDSVYVFAFYAEEIMIPAGPASINGLPGAILGLTIPRLFTSWIATKVNVNGVDVSSIKLAATKKPYNNIALKKFIDDRVSDWWSGGEETDDNKQQKNRFIWGMLL